MFYERIKDNRLRKGAIVCLCIAALGAFLSCVTHVLAQVPRAQMSRFLSATSPPTLQISDVLGLQQALTIRPTSGVGFAVSRGAVISPIGSIEGATGNLSDCIHVDGTSGPCSTSTSNQGPIVVDNEIPFGSINGINASFALSGAPNPTTSLHVYRNGLRLTRTIDYTLSSNVVTFIGVQIPSSNDSLLVDYTR
jgi:hypothetical protein